MKNNIKHLFLISMAIGATLVSMFYNNDLIRHIAMIVTVVSCYIGISNTSSYNYTSNEDDFDNLSPNP